MQAAVRFAVCLVVAMVFLTGSGDLNNDGRLDLVSSDHGSGGSTVYLSLEAGEFEEPVEVKTGKLPHAIVLVDLDRDDFLDPAVAHSTEEGSISIWEGRGNARRR